MTDALPDQDVCRDLAAEHADLDAIVAGIDETPGSLATPAPGWSVADQIAHLAFFDARAPRRWPIPTGSPRRWRRCEASGGLETVARRSSRRDARR